jgi:hypothetical protein
LYEQLCKQCDLKQVIFQSEKHLHHLHHSDDTRVNSQKFDIALEILINMYLCKVMHWPPQQKSQTSQHGGIVNSSHGTNLSSSVMVHINETLNDENTFHTKFVRIFGDEEENEIRDHHRDDHNKETIREFVPVHLHRHVPPHTILQNCKQEALRTRLFQKFHVDWALTAEMNLSNLLQLYHKTSQMSHRNNSEHPLSFLFIQPENGLGNRLRALASAAAVAEHTNRILVIIWLVKSCAFARYKNFMRFCI